MTTHVRRSSHPLPKRTDFSAYVHFCAILHEEENDDLNLRIAPNGTPPSLRTLNLASMTSELTERLLSTHGDDPAASHKDVDDDADPSCKK